MPPIKVPRYWEILIRFNGVGIIFDQRIDKVSILSSEPRMIKIANDGCSINKITVVEVMIIIITFTNTMKSMNTSKYLCVISDDKRRKSG